MGSNFNQNMAGIRRALGENFGVRGTRNIAAWAVAGTLAYYLWVKPGQKAELLRQEDLKRRKEWAKVKGLEEVDRISPKPDPQVAGQLRAHQQREKEL